MALDIGKFTSRISKCELDKTTTELVQKTDSEYVKRWIVRGGKVIVTETGQPNLWLSKSTYDRFRLLKSLAIEIEFKTDLDRTSKQSPGRHSGVHSSFGSGDIDLVRVRFDRLEDFENVVLEIAAEKWKTPQ